MLTKCTELRCAIVDSYRTNRFAIKDDRDSAHQVINYCRSNTVTKSSATAKSWNIFIRYCCYRVSNIVPSSSICE